MNRRTLIWTVVALGFLGMAMTGSAAASSEPFDSQRVPGLMIFVDCAVGKGYVEVRNPDTAGSTIEVTLDGIRQPDLVVDPAGALDEWYTVAAGQPHSLSIVYDFVPGGTSEEVDQVMTVSCLDEGPPKVPTTPPITSAPTTTTAPTTTSTSTTVPVTTTTPTTTAAAPPTVPRYGVGTQRVPPPSVAADGCRPLKQRGCI